MRVLVLAPLRLGRLTLCLFAHRLVQKPQVMLGMLLKVLGSDTIPRQLCIPGEALILLDNLLRCTAHFAFRARAVEDAIDDVPDVTIAVTVLVARARFV